MCEKRQMVLSLSVRCAQIALGIEAKYPACVWELREGGRVLPKARPEGGSLVEFIYPSPESFRESADIISLYNRITSEGVNDK